MRIGDVALYAFYGEPAGQRSASSVLYGVAQRVDGSRFTDNAIFGQFSTRRQGAANFDRAVDRRAFLVGRYQQADGALVPGVRRDEFLSSAERRGGHECG